MERMPLLVAVRFGGVIAFSVQTGSDLA